MARLPLIFFLAVAVFTCIAGGNEDTNAKLLIIKREALSAANAVREISIGTPQNKVRVASLASDFAVGLSYALDLLNNVILNINTDQGRTELAITAQEIARAVNDIHKTLASSERVKEQLVDVLEGINASINESVSDFKLPDYFVNNQFKKENDIIIFAIYKLKLQAKFFDKPNNELEPEFEKSLTAFIGTIKSIASTERIVDQELRHVLEYVALLTSRCIYKYQNWIEVNPSNTNAIKDLEEIIKAASGLYQKEILALGKYHITQVLKGDLGTTCYTGVEITKKLLRINYPNNTGGDELIRSCAFDSLAVLQAYKENIDTILINV